MREKFTAVSLRPWNGLSLALASFLLLAQWQPAQALSRKVEEITTPGGLKVWLAEEHSLPLVTVRFSFEGGAMLDPRGKEGLATLMTSLLSEGAGELDFTAFARRVAANGAQLSISVTRDQIYGTLNVLSKRLGEASELVKLALTKPRFDAGAVERVKGQLLAELEIASNDPKQIVLNRWYSEAFPDQLYGRPVRGTAESTRNIETADLLSQHERLLGQESLKIVIVGDVDPKRAAQLTDAIFLSLPKRISSASVSNVKMSHMSKPTVIVKDFPAATAIFGGEAPAPRDPDHAALLVLRQIVGSGDFNSLLMEEIRVKRGLAYAVSLSLLGDSAASIMLGGMSTKNENMNEALNALRSVLNEFAANGPDVNAFTNAKNFLKGSYVLDIDTNAKMAGYLLRLWIEGRTPRYLSERNADIERVSVADVKRLAAQVLSADRLNYVVVGKASSH